MAPPGASPPQADRLLVAAVVGSQFGPPFMFSAVAVVLPALAADVGAGATALGLVETLFLAGSLAALLPLGWLADRTDKRALYQLGLALFGATSILVGALSWMPAILALRLLQGITSAAVAATGPAILADLVPPERRGRAFGAAIGAVYAGLTLGPIVAGVFVEHAGWRAVFFVGGAVVLAGHALVRGRLPSEWRRPGASLHLPSVGLVVAAVGCLVAGAASAHADLRSVALFGLGIGLAIRFAVVQRRLEHPLLDVRAIAGNRELRSALLVQMLLYTSAFASIFVLSTFVQVSLGRSAGVAGGAIAAGSIVMAVLAPFSGRLADRVRPDGIARCGVTAIVASSALGATLDRDAGVGRVTLVLAIQGLGFALFTSPNMTRIMNSVPARASGTASALAALSRSLGMVTGMLATTTFVASQIGGGALAEHADEFAATTRHTFVALTAGAAGALAVAWGTRSRG